MRKNSALPFEFEFTQAPKVEGQLSQSLLSIGWTLCSISALAQQPVRSRVHGDPAVQIFLSHQQLDVPASMVRN